MVEGDDSIFVCDKDKSQRVVDLLTSLGMRVKVEGTYDRAGDAGFCHLWWSEDHTMMTEPLSRLQKMCWSSSSSQVDA